MTVSKLVSGQSSLPSQNPTKSFWHTQPSSFLLGHRTTASLPATTDLVIIGSGISGTSAAHYLRENQNGKDLDIVMLEAREACWGATGRERLERWSLPVRMGGALSFLFGSILRGVPLETPPFKTFSLETYLGGNDSKSPTEEVISNSPFTDRPILYSRPVDIGCFEIRNYEAVKALVEEKNIQCDWKSLPSVHAYFTESSFQEAKEQTQAFKSLAPELGNLVTIVTKDSVNPSLAELRVPTAAGVIIQAKAASLWPYKLVAGILEDLLSRNNQTTTSALKGSFNLQTNTPVTHLQKLATAKDHPWIVHTARGMIATKQILLTTNGYTSHLLPSFSDLIVPVRGEMSSLLPPKTMSPINSGANSPLTHTYYFIGKQLRKVHQDDYLVQRPFSTTTTSSSDNSTKGGELMFGGGRGFALKGGVGISDDSEIDPPAAAYLRRELNSMLDVHNTDPELQASMEWSGIMGYSRDRHPWVGKVSTKLGGGEGLWICAGYTGHGMPNTHLCGKAVADMILEKKREDIDLPESYWISEERVVKAKGLEVVAVTEGEEGGS